MLPNFGNNDEKKAFAQKIYDMFLKDPRVTNMLKKDGKPGLSLQWPWDSIEAELKRNEGKKLLQYNNGAMPNTQMDAMMHTAHSMLLAAENIIYTDNLSDNEMERYMEEIGNSMGLFQDPTFCEPLSTMKNYLDGYGKGATGSPVMNFFMGISQTVNNVVLTNDIMCQEPNAISDKEEEKLINANQEQLEKEENELAQMCAENNIDPANIQNEYLTSQINTTNARNELNKKIAAETKAKNQIEGIDANKLISEISELETKRDTLKIDARKLRDEASALSIFDENRIRIPLSNFSNERSRIDKEQHSIDQRSQKFTALLDTAVKEKEKAEKEQEQLTADNPELTEKRKEYDRLSNRREYLQYSIDGISEAFEKIDEGNTQINRYLQGKIEASDLNDAERSALDDYLEAKSAILEDEYAEGIDKEKMAALFEQAEKSDHMSIGSMLLKEDGPLKTRLKEVRQEEKKMTDANPDLQKKLDLEAAIKKQSGIIESQTLNLDSLKNNQESLNYSKEELAKREQNFNKGLVELLETNNALPKNKTKEQLLHSNPDAVVGAMRNAVKQKDKANEEKNKELRNINNDLKSKQKMAAKIKIAKESAPEILNLKQQAVNAEKKMETMETIYNKGQAVERILRDRENSVRALRENNAMNRENAVREGFTRTLKSLNQQVPAVKGEKNSEAYDNMRKGLNELLEKMQSSSYKAEDRAKDFGDLQKLAQKYLDEKNKQWRPFPTQKRKDRQRLAQDIVTFCENSKKLSAETPSVNPNVLHEAARRDPSLSTSVIAEQKFKEQMKPKVEAAKIKLQKNVNQPVNQAQKNQTALNVSQLG